MKITFLGATEQVTGSKYLVEHDDLKLLVDCGLFQGGYKTTQQNWDTFPLDPARINSVVLTHAHSDHTGYIPLLVKNGFRGKIYCSQATYELCEILLLDNGNLQEESANRYNEHRDLNSPAVKPLYTKADAQYSLQFFQVIDYDTVLNLGVLTITLIRCSHILGSSFVILSDGKRKLTFSGDLGSSNQLIMKSPSYIKQTDYLVLESTYGDRLHQEGDPIGILGQIINTAIKQGGKILIPAFAVGRTQTILYCLYQLKQKKIISDIPIFLDSPMAISVTQLFCDFKDDYTIPVSACKEILTCATFIRTLEESKSLDHLAGPAIIIAGSGMMEGGRMLYHLQKYISDPKNIVVLVGYQAVNTSGNSLAEGAKEIKIFGKTYEVRAQIKTVDLFSAHADYDQILEWLGHLEEGPKKIFLTHGDFKAAQSLKEKIEQRYGWSVIIPKYKESFNLDLLT
jgi:metallo-beta-lactamase family protein